MGFPGTGDERCGEKECQCNHSAITGKLLSVRPWANVFTLRERVCPGASMLPTSFSRPGVHSDPYLFGPKANSSAHSLQHFILIKHKN